MLLNIARCKSPLSAQLHINYFDHTSPSKQFGKFLAAFDAARLTSTAAFCVCTQYTPYTHDSWPAQNRVVLRGGQVHLRMTCTYTYVPYAFAASRLFKVNYLQSLC